MLNPPPLRTRWKHAWILDTTLFYNNTNIRTVMRHSHGHLPLTYVKEPYGPNDFCGDGEQL